MRTRGSSYVKPYVQSSYVQISYVCARSRDRRAWRRRGVWPVSGLRSPVCIIFRRSHFLPRICAQLCAPKLGISKLPLMSVPPGTPGAPVTCPRASAPARSLYARPRPRPRLPRVHTKLCDLIIMYPFQAFTLFVKSTFICVISEIFWVRHNEDG